MMEEALRAWLLADATIAGLIGDRVFWDVRRQGSALPALVLSRISGLHGYTYQGSDGLWTSRVQFNCLAATNTQARALERAVRARFPGGPFQQSVTVSAVTTVTRFAGCFLDSVRDLTVASPVEGEPVYCPSIDYKILHEEP